MQTITNFIKKIFEFQKNRSSQAIKLKIMEFASFSDQPQMEDQPTTMDLTQSPEYLQRKLYFLLEQLKMMHAVLPE